MIIATLRRMSKKLTKKRSNDIIESFDDGSGDEYVSLFTREASNNDPSCIRAA